jgi:serine/threonine-protein kinase
VIAGKYQVERVLGEGGMGYVVAARHIALGQMFALKFMRAEVVTKEYRSRFRREAQNTVKLRSRHVARVSDVGETPEGIPYMVMEYLEGKDLSDLLAARLKDGRGPFAVPEACDYLIQACEAIAEAHANGIVHRDLKPANLFLTRGTGGEQIVKVLDFGVSKVLELGMDEDTNPGGRVRGKSHNPDSAVTKATDLLGSPSYMAPEQIVSARDADIRSDVWSLGVILFRLVSGKAPFGGSSLGELIQAIMHGPMPDIRQFRPDIPAGLENVVARCLERERGKRLADVTELARLLSPYAAPVATPSLERIALLGPALVTAPPPAPSGPSSSSSRAGGAWTRGHAPPGSLRSPSSDISATTAIILAGIFVLALAFGVAAFALRVKAAPPPLSPAMPTNATPDVLPDPTPPAVSLPMIELGPTPSGKPSAAPKQRPRGGGVAPTAPKNDIPSTRE